MKADKLFLAIMLIFIPLTVMAQQIPGVTLAGNGLSRDDALAVITPKAEGSLPNPAMTAKDYDPIGNEEEMDAADSSDFDYQEWLLMWPEQDEGRDYDPMDPREDAQEADPREE